jgi:hypothetical protein
MKKPAQVAEKSAKRTKRTPAEKSQRKSAKAESRATSALNDDRAAKKASQKSTLKAAAKELQKELNNRMNEVVDRIRKETKAKLKEVVKEATRRLDVDTERMFEQALHTIVRHYDSISTGTSSAAAASASTPVTSDNLTADTRDAGTGRLSGKTLNKDGTPRKPRTARTDVGVDEAEAPRRRGPKPGSKRGTASSAGSETKSQGRRGPKPRPVVGIDGNTTNADNNGAGEDNA